MKKLSSILRLPILSLTLAIAGGCASAPKSEPTLAAGGQTGKSSMLTREAAMYRSRQVHKIAYNVWLKVDETSEEFQGRTRISFELRENAFQNLNHLRIDFTGGKITSLLLNGTTWMPEKIAKVYNGEWIQIPKGDLVTGANRIDIAYTHPYSQSGNGFYRFKDPEDGAVYLHTDLEPYYANLVLPVFDQPDLKATFDVTVQAPNEWTIVGNMPLREKTKVDGDSAWSFAQSPLMSTYLFAVMAGPWKMWKSDFKGMPLALFARQSLAKYVDANDWFKVTRTGLDFFSDYFGYAYPYPKYDQIIVPDHNAGAMENIGAVTFNEGFVFRGPATEEKRKDRADTILHEMAHMWFGDLVTMRWWNGLWLNESFATYLSSVALERTKLFSGAPQSFFAGMKRWAYAEDQLPTTHSIEVSVPDTNQAMANFDGITYGKGASALKQFHYGLGDDDFQEGLQRYFTRFANRNTALADFINTMAQTSDKNLTPWVKSWLQNHGYNRIGAEWTCGDDGKISKFELVQKTEGVGNPLRPHRLQIGFFHRDQQGRFTKRGKGIRTAIESERANVEEAVGEKCPDLVFPNDEDFGYFMVDLDPKSLEAAKTSLSKVSDAFTRHLLAYTLWEMVRAGKWTLSEFAEASAGWLATETNKTLIEDLSDILAHSRRMSVARLLEGEARAKFLDRIHTLARRKAETSARGSDLQRIWFTLALRTMAPTDAEWALAIHAGKRKLPGLKVDPDLRWDILTTVARVAPIDSATLEAAGKADPSSEGQGRMLEVLSALETSSVTNELPALFTLEKTDANIPNARLRKAMSTYLSYSRIPRAEAWRPKFFASLSAVAAKSDDSYFRSFAQSLYPSQCSDAVADETTEWLKSNSKAPRTLRIALRKMAFAEKWCAAIRAGRPFPLWQSIGED